MAEQLQITFRHMVASAALRELADERLRKLQAHFPDVLDCHVVVDPATTSRHRKGSVCAVRVEVTLAREHVRVSAERSHADAHVGMRDAFESVRRQLASRVDRRAS